MEGNRYPPVSSVCRAKSIIDIDISQFGKRGSESINFCRLSLDLKRERRTSLYPETLNLSSKSAHLTHKSKAKVCLRNSSVHLVGHLLFPSPAEATKCINSLNSTLNSPRLLLLKTVPTSKLQHHKPFSLSPTDFQCSVVNTERAWRDKAMLRSG